MTVEAVFVMSFVLLVILWIMNTAIEMYQETVETAMVRWIEIDDTAGTFRRIFFIGELLPKEGGQVWK